MYGSAIHLFHLPCQKKGSAGLDKTKSAAVVEIRALKMVVMAVEYLQGVKRLQQRSLRKPCCLFPTVFCSSSEMSVCGSDDMEIYQERSLRQLRQQYWLHPTAFHTSALFEAGKGDKTQKTDD